MNTALVYVAALVVGLFIAAVTRKIAQLEFQRGRREGLALGETRGRQQARQETIDIWQGKRIEVDRKEYMRGMDEGLHRGTREERERWLAVGIALVAAENNAAANALIYRYVEAAQKEGCLSADTVAKTMDYLGVDVMHIDKEAARKPEEAQG